MCGRFSLSTDATKVAELFRLEDLSLFKPRYNIAPSQPVACVSVGHETGRRTFRHLHWGLVPPWAKEPSIGARMINARSETAAEKPAFRKALQRRRCLLPADGFYEWRKVGQYREPHFIYLASREIFGFAGLFEHWQDENGNELESCTILTCAANEMMAELHDRMPVILPSEHHAAWLDPAQEDTSAVSALLRPLAAGLLDHHVVSARVNKTVHDDAGLVEPVEREGLF
jgi:putative SOS response-associated peptidase YedK